MRFENSLYSFGFLSLLKRYFQVYWLKPFDAINDTANAVSLLNFDWASQNSILEIGGGDGIFSFIMHGGEFNFINDRYDQVDLLNKGDIYDFFSEKGAKFKIKTFPTLNYDMGVDLKMSHVFKAKETMLYKNNNIISSHPEDMPIKNDSFDTVFLYTFHGLVDYDRTLREIRRIISENGTLLMLVFNDVVDNHFICYKLSKFFEKRNSTLSGYFKKLDGGRYDEIANVFSKNFEEWKLILNEAGFEIKQVYTQVLPWLWRLYDTQTRFVLKNLIRFNKFLKRIRLKFLFKIFWTIIWFPILTLAYIAAARPAKVQHGKYPKGVFLTFLLTPKELINNP